ncbi:MAG: hypothetical protein IMW89_08630 [Ktedonobacteraceae bacterium]|nr:hypothetical protein [Ktedonobacteraceae bacterium]
MSTRLLSFLLLAIIVIGGLTAGLFSSAIQRSLTLASQPVRSVQQGTAAQPARPAQTSPVPQASALVPTPMPTLPAQMPTNILAQDTFQRPNQPLWGMAADGRTWGGDANIAKNAQIFTIDARTGKINGAQGTLNAVLGPTSPNSEVALSGMVNRFADGVNLGAVVRWTDDNNWYKVLIDGTHLSIIKRVQGASAIIKSLPFKAQANAVYTLRFRAIGAMLFARVWRVDMPEPARWMITATDTALSTGQNGLRVVVRNDTVITITSFVATTASSTV